MSYDKEIDVMGKACPIPLITIAKEVCDLVKGQTLRITGNDPIFEESIVEFCRERGYEVTQTSREGKRVSMVVKL